MKLQIVQAFRLIKHTSIHYLITWNACTILKGNPFYLFDEASTIELHWGIVPKVRVNNCAKVYIGSRVGIYVRPGPKTSHIWGIDFTGDEDSTCNGTDVTLDGLVDRNGSGMAQATEPSSATVPTEWDLLARLCGIYCQGRSKDNASNFRVSRKARIKLCP